MKHVLATEAKQGVFSEGSKLFSEGLKGSHYIANALLKKYSRVEKRFFNTSIWKKSCGSQI